MSVTAKSKPETVKSPKGPKVGRSPAYPGIDLQKALEQSKKLYDAEGKYAAPMSSAFAAWGFGAKSSGGRETKAALRYFGLITTEGDGAGGKVKLTDRALRIILDDREDLTEKKDHIREIALAPSIHRVLFEKFPDGLKSDATVEHFLMFEQNYNKKAAGELVAEFKATADYAGLFKPAIVPDIDQSNEDSDEGRRSSEPDQNRQSGGQKGRVKVMENERVVFTEEGGPNQYLKLIASGDLDDVLLEALEDYVKRQRKRLGLPTPSSDGSKTVA